MYLTFFGFREKPFNLTPDPKFLYLNASYREALAQLRYGINERKGFVSLIGEAGTGKTTLLRRLLAELGHDVRTVLILNPAVDFDELLVFILTDLGHTPAPGTPKLQLLQMLNADLLDTLARGGNVVVLIDEAQDLSIQVLEELRLLSNLETAKEKILQLVLAGQPELDEMLARPELRQLRQRIAVPARLRPLGRGEVAAYVAARISAAGGDARGLFTPSALRQLYGFSRGVPRLVNVACDSGLVTAYAAGTRVVDAKIMREAIRDLSRGPYRQSVARAWRTRLATVAVAGVLGVLMGFAASRVAHTPLTAWRVATQPTASVEREMAAAAQPQRNMERRTDRDSAINVPLRSPLVHTNAAVTPTANTNAGASERDAGADGTRSQGGVAVASAVPEPTPVLEPTETASAAVGPAAEVPAVGQVRTFEATPEVTPTVPAAPTAALTPPPVMGVVSNATAAPPTPLAFLERRVVVQNGDDLTHIARRSYGYVDDELLVRIQRANPGIVNRNLLIAGQEIVLPADAPIDPTPPAGADASVP
jgi:general secretion pathway protein A